MCVPAPARVYGCSLISEGVCMCDSAGDEAAQQHAAPHEHSLYHRSSACKNVCIAGAWRVLSVTICNLR